MPEPVNELLRQIRDELNEQADLLERLVWEKFLNEHPELDGLDDEVNDDA